MGGWSKRVTYCFYIAQGSANEARAVAWAEQHRMAVEFVDRVVRFIGKGEVELQWGHIASTDDRDVALLYKLMWGGK